MHTEPSLSPATLIAGLETQVAEAIRRHGPKDAYHRLIAENDALILGADLDNGQRIVAARSAIHTVLVRHWAATVQGQLGYDRPFAVVALGGTGRGEVTPCSDLDFAFLVDDVIEGNPLLRELQRQAWDTEEFRAAYGFAFEPLAFGFEDAPRLEGKQLNAFLDLWPVHDPDGLAARFLERIRATYDPFEHFLHVRGFWKDHLEPAAAEFERLDAFDIKHDALRVFLAGIWTLAGQQFRHSHEVYAALEDVRDLEAYWFLLRVRCFVHARHGPSGRHLANGAHPEDRLAFEDFLELDRLLGPEADEAARFEFGNRVRARLVGARRRVARFTRAIIARELSEGRAAGHASPIVYGPGGLRHRGLDLGAAPRERSRAALLLLLASQRYGVPIDAAELQRTFRDAGDWLVPVPELASLFYEPRGSLAGSFQFLSQFEGAEECLFPGYARFEASIDERVMSERKVLRGAIERRKTEVLEELVAQGREAIDRAVRREPAGEPAAEVSPAIEAALLDPDELAAVRLALKTKRLPLTPDDEWIRADASRPRHERFSSGLSNIPLDRYYGRYRDEAGFSDETIRLTEFLIVNRRAFREWTAPGLNPGVRVAEFVRRCGNDARRLRSLFVFTCADRAEWHSPETDPARWFLTRELYFKALRSLRPAAGEADDLAGLGFAPDEQAILRDFGPDFFNGVYAKHARTFGAHLLRLARSTAFFVDDLAQPAAFATRLREPSDPVSACLHRSLPLPVREALREWAPLEPPPPALLQSLVQGLNVVLRAEPLYEAERFAGVALRPGTRRLLEAEPEAQDPVRLNRLLVEDAYPSVVLPSPESAGPKASLLRDGASVIVAVAARDFRGLAACITGVLWHGGRLLQQAHLFSATHYGLALDFFHVESGDASARGELLRSIEDAIVTRRHLGEADLSGLPLLEGRTTLQEWQAGEYCLRHEAAGDRPGLVYALCFRVYHHLGANIFALSAHAARGGAFVSIYLSLPPGLPLDTAHRLVAENFR